jgi:hypothetical protein
MADAGPRTHAQSSILDVDAAVALPSDRDPRLDRRSISSTWPSKLGFLHEQEGVGA